MQFTKSQLMQYVIAGRMHESFNHSIEGSFDTTLMREFARNDVFKDKPELELRRCSMQGMEQFIREHIVVDEDRVGELDEKSWKLDPVLIVEYPEQTEGSGPCQLIVDGAHRILRRIREGCDDFIGIVFRPDQVIRPDNTKYIDGRFIGFDWGGNPEDLPAQKG